MDKYILYEQKVSEVLKSEVVILRDVNRFPVYGKEFVTPNLVICFGHSGYGRALYDLKEVYHRANDVAIVMPNHMFCPLESSDDYLITMVIVSSEFCKELKNRTYSHDFSKFHTSPQHHLTDEDMKTAMKMVDLFETVCNKDIEQLPYRHEMLCQLLNISLELINASRSNIDSTLHKNRNNALFSNFCDLLAEHYRESHEVAYYAELLNLTPKYFSKVIQETIGVTASQWIDEYITTQAKQILSTRSDLNIQQVGYQLGFAEPASFCRYFKRVCGITPSQYRKIK